MKISVYSLQKILFEGEAELLNCKTVIGEITILDNHRSLIGQLVPGVMKIIDTNKKDHYIPVRSGFIEVSSRNQVRCLMEEGV